MRCVIPFMIVLLPAASVYGDGMMTVSELRQSVSMVDSPKQEALIVLDKHAGQVTVSLRTHFRAGPTDLAWVVPVPAVPENIKEGTEEIFVALEAETTPEIRIFTSNRFKFGCAAGGTSRVQQAVSVVEAGTAGIFDYAVLSASNSQVLETWLHDHEYRVPTGADQAFRRYVDLGWHWLAIRVRAEAQDRPQLAPHPITYTYRSMKVEYPLAISRLSASDQIEVVLYILADCEYGGENWANAELSSEELTLDSNSPSGTSYEALFRQSTAQHGGHLLVTELASDLDTVGYRPLLAKLRESDAPSEALAVQEQPKPCYLTRLRAVVSKDALDRDITLVPTRVSEYDFVLNSYYIHVPAEGQQALTAWAGTLGFVAVMAVIYIALRSLRRHV